MDKHHIALFRRVAVALPRTSPNHTDVCFRGLWNVPFVSNCYLINATVLNNESTRPFYGDPDGDLDADVDAEMAFAQKNRREGVFMYVSNRLNFGHLVNPDTYDTKLVYPDMYQIMDNKLDWERRYIHPEYTDNFNPDKKPTQVANVGVYVHARASRVFPPNCRCRRRYRRCLTCA